ncbi:MAG: carboxysome shell carbonic anhydrase [Acidiferrobacter thiooxydans]
MDTRKSALLRRARHGGDGAGVSAGRLPQARSQVTWPRSGAMRAEALGVAHPACDTLPGRTCRHALVDRVENARLFGCEQETKARFDGIVPALQEIAALGRGTEFAGRAQTVARERLGFELPMSVLDRAWVRGADMGSLYAHAVFQALSLAVARFSDQIREELAAGQGWDGLLVDCGFHAMNVSACADGRLKGLFPYILRMPASALVRSSAFAGTLFDVEEDVRHWEHSELRRFRDGFPTTADAQTRYLKVAVYHTSSLDPAHEGCAAHGSSERAATEAALERLNEFRAAIENEFCCGAGTDLLLIGVDTDTDAIRIHIPDAKGDLSAYRSIDNAELYRRTLELDADRARLAVYEAIEAASATDGWGKGEGMPHDGMRRLIATLLVNNMSQIEYVAEYHGGWYGDNGHGERFVSVGDGFPAVQVRNIAYYARIDTVEEGVADLDVGVKIFRHLNVERGLPIPVALHYHFDGRVPGSRRRVEGKIQRVAEAIRARYGRLAEDGLLHLHGSIQDLEPGSALEEVALR